MLIVCHPQYQRRGLCISHWTRSRFLIRNDYEINGDDYDDTLNAARVTTNRQLFLAILFSFLTVAVLVSVAAGDLLNAPKGPVEKIFKAPQPGKGQKLLDDGFDPNDFPLDELSDGRAYFGKQRQLADKYDDVYGDGVLELEIPKDIYDARIRPHEVPYLSDPNFTELPLPHDVFDILNDAVRKLHPTRK